MRQINRTLSAPVRVPWKPPVNARGHDTDMFRSIVPALGGSAPLMSLISVDLPAPFRPRIPTRSPGLIVKSISLRTRRQPTFVR